VSGVSPWVISLVLTALTLLFLAPVSSSLWFLAVLVRVMHRRQALEPGWRWLSAMSGAQWAGLALFEFALWAGRGPFVAYLAAIFGLGAAVGLLLFTVHFPGSLPYSRQVVFAMRFGLVLVPLAMLSMGVLFLTEGWY
jgi:hypothetical protein